MTVLLSIIAAFLPVLFWGYLFSYFDNSPLNSRRFFAGIVAGGVAIAFILSLDTILSKVGLDSLNAFHLVVLPPSFELARAFLSAYGAMIGVGALGSLAVVCALFGQRPPLGRTVLALLLFFAFGLVVAALWYLASFVGLYGRGAPGGPSVLQGVEYATVGSILLYYVLVAASEEGVKHAGFLAGVGSDASRLDRTVLVAGFVALGFAFVENILYLSHLGGVDGASSGLFWKTWGYRSVFSILLHALCAIVLASAFFRSGGISLSLPARLAAYAVSGVALSVGLHFLFDASLMLGFPGIIFAYLVGGYLYFTRFFTGDSSELLRG